MNVNYVAILIATVLEFIVGAVWYGPLFSNLWGKMHGFHKLPKETQEKMMKEMGPYYATQFIVTLVSTYILAIFIAYQPTWNAYVMAAMFWLGFIVPAQISGVIFGGTEGKWIVPKILVQAGAALACIEVAAAVLKMM